MICSTRIGCGVFDNTVCCLGHEMGFNYDTYYAWRSNEHLLNMLHYSLGCSLWVHPQSFPHSHGW